MQRIILNGLELADLLAEVRLVVREEVQALAPPIDLPDIGGIELAEEITGLTRPTIYGLVSKQKLPHFKRGKKLYFSRTDLESWIKSGRKKTISEIESEVLSSLNPVQSTTKSEH